MFYTTSYGRRIFLSIFCFLLLVCLKCNDKSHHNLSKLSRNEILELHRNKTFNLDKAVFLNSSYKKITKQEVQKLKTGELASDFYSDSLNIIRQVIVRPATYHDNITSILIANLDYNPRDTIPLMLIDCDSLKYTIKELYTAEAEDLPELKGGDTLSFFDFQRAKIVSIENSCGLLALKMMGEEILKVFWSMVQHNKAQQMAYYYPFFEQVVENGDLSEERLALMTDRLLMNNNYPQVYGSQILNHKLYPIRNPDSVDYRRATIGLEPLEEYLKNFDLD